MSGSASRTSKPAWVTRRAPSFSVTVGSSTAAGSRLISHTAYRAPSTAVPAPTCVNRPATTADQAPDPRLKAKMAARIGSSPTSAVPRGAIVNRFSAIAICGCALCHVSRARKRNRQHPDVESVLKSHEMRFPDSFLWGAATAAHQIEGNNVRNDWWRAEEAGLVPHRSGEACDSWNRWADDIRLLQEMGLNAYRLSVEWARIEPQAGHFDQTALDTYRRMLEGLRTAGVEPVVTLHHFTSPAWLADRGGWSSPDVVPRLADYADRVGRATGDLVRWWVTINEPSILGYKAYLEGSWPPNRSGDLRGYVRVQRFAARAHRVMREALKVHRPDTRVSMAFAVWPMEPLRPWSPVDQLMARLGDWVCQGRLID